MATQTSSRDTTQTSSQQQTEGQQQSRTGTGLTRQGQGGQVPSLWRQSETFFPLNPFSLVRRLQEDMDQLLGNITSTGSASSTATLWVPPVDITEKMENS